MLLNIVEEYDSYSFQTLLDPETCYDHVYRNSTTIATPIYWINLFLCHGDAKIGSAKQGKEFEELSSELLLPSALISPTAAGHLFD